MWAAVPAIGLVAFLSACGGNNTSTTPPPPLFIGLFRQRGGWQVSPGRLKLWDGEEHRSGRACPNGRDPSVVDGVEQHGDPSIFAPRNGQVVVLSFDSDPAPPSAPPQMAAQYLPPLGAATK